MASPPARGPGLGARAESGRISRAVGVLSSATFLSRILGLIRDIVLAAWFGAGGGLDAFFVAFRLPNTLRRLFAEGSLTVAFVPVFVDVAENEGRRRAEELGRRAFTLLGLVLAAVVVVGCVAAPAVVRLTAWGFTRDPAKFALTVDLTRWVFPYIGLIGLTALAGGMLNAWGVFSYPALAPVVLNLCLIGAAVGLSGFLDPPVQALAYGVLVGGALQLALQMRPLARLGFRYRPAWPRRDPAIGRVLRLMGPTVFGVAVYQVNILVSTLLASWLPDGSVSYLYYAERLFQLPLGVFVVSVGTASLPSLSRLAARGDHDGFGRTLNGALRMSLFVALPAAAGLAILARPVFVVLFQRGAFDAVVVHESARALVGYALALVPVAGVRVLAPAYYALHDTRTPVWAAFWALWVNLGASLVLMGPFQHAGLAAATAISGAFNLAYLAWGLRTRVGPVAVRGLGAAAARTAVAGGAMAALVAAGAVRVAWTPGSAASAGALAALVLGGAGVYAAACLALGVPDARRAWAAVARRLGRRS